MARAEQDAAVDDDVHGLLFGPDDAHLDAEHPVAALSRVQRRHASQEHVRHRRRRHHQRGLVVLTALLVIVVGLAVWLVALPRYNARYHPKDFSGTGVGSVQIQVNSGDTAHDIGTTLVRAGVVASTRAFTNAAAANPNSQSIEPGTYLLRKHMSAANAVIMLLTPGTRISARVVVAEGATSAQVAAALSAALRVPLASVQAAIADVNELALPSTYTVGSAAPTSAEGFLYPATYTFDPGTKPADALSKMINTFIEQDRSSGFAARAQALKLTPYQALTIASVAQSEAKFPADMAKVARVILNRIAARMPLQIDAISRYGAALQGLNPSTVNYATLTSPYNSYTHAGLPPTPISNPGADALAAAANPTPGDWLYYVNADGQGDLFFTNSVAAFTQAQQRCHDNNWGCAAP